MSALSGGRMPSVQHTSDRPVPRPGTDGLGVPSLTLGILGFLPIPGLPASILAVVLGFLGGKDSTTGRRSRLATAGMTLGGVGIAGAAVISIFYFGILGYPLPQIHRYRPDN
jgi:hypothetical protein